MTEGAVGDLPSVTGGVTHGLDATTRRWYEATMGAPGDFPYRDNEGVTIEGAVTSLPGVTDPVASPLAHDAVTRYTALVSRRRWTRFQGAAGAVRVTPSAGRADPCTGDRR